MSQNKVEDLYEGGFELEAMGGQDNIPIIKEMAEAKIAGYNPEKKDEDEWEGEQIGWYTLVTRYADGADMCYLWAGLFGAFAFGAAMPAFCYYFGTMIDGVGAVQSDAGTGGGMGDLQEQSYMMVWIGVAAFVVSWFQVTCLSIFAENVQYKIRIKYFEAVLEKDAEWFDAHNPAEMASKIAKEVVTIQRGSGEKIGQVVMSVTTFFLGFAAAFLLGWLYTLILFGMAPIIAATGVLMAVSMEDGFKEQMKSYGQSAGYAEQALQAIQVVHTYGQEALESKNYEKYLLRAQKTAHSQITKNAIGVGGMFLSFFILYAYAFYFGGVLRWNKVEATPGVVYSGGRLIGVLFCVVFGAMMLGGAGPHLKGIAEGRIAGRVAFEAIDAIPSIKVNEPGTAHVTQADISGQIKFTNVNFTYPSRPDVKVLKGFTEVFEPGQTTALVGPSGSGKSTIIQMLERFYDPQEGTIELDNKDLKSLNLSSLRQSIGFVSQEPVLFNTSIRENLLFAKQDATEEDMINALKDANAWKFITEKFVDGLDTMVGSGGGQLSGGQKQRIAIARAFIKKPKILLLDEATSALDKVNEKFVQDAIDRYRVKQQGMSIVVIAHRLSTIKDADKIIVIKDGVKVEVGNNETLLRDFPDGVYANFCAKQANAEASADQAENSDEEKAMDAEVQALEAADAKINQSGGALNQSMNRSLSLSRKLSIKNELSPEEIEMKELADKQDAVIEAQQKKDAEEHAKVGGFTKLLVYNNPKILMVIGLFCTMPSGLANPICGIAFAKILTLLSLPIEFLKYIDPAGEGGVKYLKSEIIFWSLGMLVIAGVCFFSFSITKKCFGTLGNNVTLEVRKILYAKILEKNIGFHDLPENGTSVLTSAMASDTHLINGVGSESIQPQIEAAMNMLGGIAIGFYFCWQESLVCLGLTPILVVGNMIGMKFQNGLTEETSEGLKEANLLCGDSIVNFRTVQSFGNTQLVVKKFQSFLEPGHVKAKLQYIKIGFAFGIAQFGQYFVFAAMFYAAGAIMQANEEIKMDDIMISLMAIMFGASQAGTAAAFGPDMGKAMAAAERIFGIIESKSEINAVELDNDSTKKRLSINDVQGNIEFKNVWFRYPTRKTDFVLRGLNIKVTAGQSVALVGESGCGKSTFVSLLMRFYDVDHGEILLDGVNIKDLNLHDLRNVISLVMQEPIIFNYSVLENILYGKINATNSEVKHVAEVSNCMEFIEKNASSDLDDSAKALLEKYASNKFGLIALLGEDKYNEEIEVLKKCQEQEEQSGGKFEAIAGDVDTRAQTLKDITLSNGFTEVQCGIKGSKLSGGQKQRVAIARTIIREPRVLLLDEATSALDEDSQKKVQEALNNAMKGRTTIVIAHRMSTIEGCDKIYVLDCGKVLEEGNFEELKNKKDGFFAKKDQNEAAATKS